MKLIEILLELLYPSRCAFCGRLVKAGENICRGCVRTLPYTAGNAAQSFENIEKCASPLYYEGKVRASLLKYKFSGCAVYSKAYGKLMADCLDEADMFCDMITWVPLSKKRLRKRGYDQARLLAEAVAEEEELPCVRTLHKLRDTPAQSGMGNRENRRKNIAGAYEVIPTEELKEKSILLIDDIVTTGSTLSECAGMLKKAGAHSVSALTVARKKV